MSRKRRNSFEALQVVDKKREEKEKQLQLDYPETFLSKMSFCC